MPKLKTSRIARTINTSRSAGTSSCSRTACRSDRIVLAAILGTNASSWSCNRGSSAFAQSSKIGTRTSARTTVVSACPTRTSMTCRHAINASLRAQANARRVFCAAAHSKMRRACSNQTVCSCVPRSSRRRAATSWMSYTRAAEAVSGTRAGARRAATHFGSETLSSAAFSQVTCVASSKGRHRPLPPPVPCITGSPRRSVMSGTARCSWPCAARVCSSKATSERMCACVRSKASAHSVRVLTVSPEAYMSVPNEGPVAEEDDVTDNGTSGSDRSCVATKSCVRRKRSMDALVYGWTHAR